MQMFHMNKKYIFGIITLILIIVAIQTKSDIITLQVSNEDEIILCSNNFNMTIDETKTFSKLIIDEQFIGFNDTFFKVYSSGNDINFVLDFLHSNPVEANINESVVEFSYNSDERLLISISDLNSSMQYKNSEDNGYTHASEKGIGYFDLGKPVGTIGDSFNVCNDSGTNIFINTGSFNVYCDPDESIKSWELELVYNVSRINITSITCGDIFDGYSQFFNDGTINHTDGIVYDIYNLIVGQGNVSDPGSLITVNYELLPNSEPSEVILFSVGVTNESEYLPVSVSNVKI